ncbi:DUF6017 domain-containing protein [Scatolibacter rhodanostii]|uniref:DUF6017 domain-containing protein n=1 Tax=Scatolibacter rhodanostii TaxID=2014781 RepID=UPI000C086B43|nr:DUF6017 domain-containing protein [Scatolibacter rhodanostii]
MAENNIFRVEKTKDFTVMSNHHFKNRRLSLKAKGLLSLMLSLPDDWDYSLSGLVRICTEGKEAINKALNELEKEGYLTRNQIRAEKGRFSRTEFIIREIPVLPCTGNQVTVKTESIASSQQQKSPYTENPSTEKPDTDNPAAEKPCPENPPQSNTKEIKELKESNTYQSIYQQENAEQYEEDMIEDILRENIEYDILIQDPDYFGSSSGRELLDSFVEIMKQPFISCKLNYRIGKEEISIAAVRSRLMKVDCEHIKYVFDSVFNATERTVKIKNMQAYLLTTLYNAPVTYHAYQADLCKDVG